MLQMLQDQDRTASRHGLPEDNKSKMKKVMQFD